VALADRVADAQVAAGNLHRFPLFQRPQCDSDIIASADLKGGGGAIDSLGGV